MAWEHLQISMARFNLLFIHVLYTKYSLSDSINTRTKIVSMSERGRDEIQYYLPSECKQINTANNDMTPMFSIYHAEFRMFEGISKYCATYSNLIPLSFVLGFYVTIVMTRWWNQYVSIPWPDTFAVFVSANIHGQVTQLFFIFF